MQALSRQKYRQRVRFHEYDGVCSALAVTPAKAGGQSHVLWSPAFAGLSAFGGKDDADCIVEEYTGVVLERRTKAAAG